MTLLLHSLSLTKSFGTKVLFTELSMSIFAKDRLGLIGPNSSGKFTFLKILAGLETPDSGEVVSKKGIRVGYVAQSCEFPDIPVEQVLMNVLASEETFAEYDKQLAVETILSKIGYSKKTSAIAASLSGGWKKRLSIAQALILSPDLLLLDEPTNHLDLEGILWLEKLLIKEVSSYILVSHDRYFLQNVANRFIEINPVYPKGMFTVNNSYSDFLTKKKRIPAGSNPARALFSLKSAQGRRLVTSNP